MAFGVIKHHIFRDFILYIYPALLPFFAKIGKTIRR
jgi:hypothetical protein